MGQLENRLDKLENEVREMKMQVQTVSGKNENKLCTLEKDMQVFKEQVDKSLVNIAKEMDLSKKPVDDTQVKTLVEEEIDKSISKELGFRPIQIEQMQETLSKTRASVEEEQDKEHRRNNIVIYRIPESEASNNTERSVDDNRFCLQLLSGLNVGVVDQDIRKVFRLGRRVEDADTGSRPRPVLVQLGSRAIKNLIMESLYKIKSMDSKFRSVIISHDMTKLEREECKKLVNEAKEKSQNESGDWIYRVRGSPGQMHIVRLRKAQ